MFGDGGLIEGSLWIRHLLAVLIRNVGSSVGTNGIYSEAQLLCRASAPSSIRAFSIEYHNHQQ